MQKELPVRKIIRLQGYDYSTAGCYFITICVKNGHSILWQPDVGTHSVRPLSDIGNAVKTAIENIPKIYEGVFIDNFVVMPNHIHLIVRLESNGRTLCVPTISRIIKQCKEYVTKQIGYSIWHTRFHDRIIRNEEEYQNKWQYIDENPTRWADDEFFVKEK